MTAPEARPGDVAVIGMAGRFPGAPSVGRLWDNLAAGVTSPTAFGDDELRAAGVPEADLRSPSYVRSRFVIDGIDEFDAGFFGVSPHDASHTDPQFRLFLESAWAALEDAGCDPAREPGPVGLFASTSWSTYLAAVASPVAPSYETYLKNDRDYLPTWISYKLDLTGPSMAVQCFCSSSLAAVHLACQSLLVAECDVALAGGVTVAVPSRVGYHHSPAGLWSPDGHCRPYDAEAAGTVVGDGVGVVVLKRLADALRDGSPIDAVIRGSAMNNDGAAKMAYMAPSARGQAEAAVQAHALAEVDPRSIGLVEGQGSSTRIGDSIEVEALTRAFRTATDERGFCALGSVKANVGHLDRASGVTALIKAVLALRHERIPPVANLREPNPALDLERTPFYLNDKPVAWPRDGEPRRAAVSVFGFGGTNVHLVLEEPPAAAAVPSARPWHLLPVAARTPEALERAAAQLAGHLRETPDAELADVAHTLQEGRRAFECRQAIVCRDVDEAVRGLEGGRAEPVDDPERAELEDRARRWAGGGEPDWAGLYRGEERRRVHLPSYPFERTRHWIEGEPARRPAVRTGSAGATRAAPAGALGERVAAAVAEALGLESVDPDASLFELGGDSMTATSIVARLQEDLGVELPLGAYLEDPRPARLVELAGGGGTDAPGRRRAPLSFGQESLWLQEQLHPGTPAHHMPALTRLQGELDLATLADALATVVARHEALRTVVAERDGRPFQEVRPAEPPAWRLIDLSGLAPGAREDELRRAAAAEAARPFDLAAGPLARFAVVRLAHDDHALAITLHHLIGDGWSIDVINDELAALYAARCDGRPSPLAPPRMQSTDHARRQRAENAAGDREDDLDYWRTALAGAVPLELPTDRPRPARQRMRGASVPLELPPPVASAVREFARRSGGTVYTTLLTALFVVLQRWSGQRDLTVGSPVSGRNHPDLQGTVANCLNMVVVRAAVERGATFEALAARVVAAVRGALAHQELPFERLVEELRPPRDLSRTPLFGVVLALQRPETPGRPLTGLAAHPEPVHGGGSEFDVTIRLFDTAAGIGGHLEYDVDLFDRVTVEAVREAFLRLVEAAVADAGTRVEGLPLVDPRRRAPLLERGAAAALEGADPRPAHEQVAARAAAAPDAPAVGCGDASLTYGELVARADAIAELLRAAGARPDEPVGVLVERSPDLPAALLGVLAAGGAAMPLDAGAPPARLEAVLARARPRVVLASRSLAERLPDADAHVCLVEDAPHEPAAPRAGAGEPVHADRLAYVMSTSGSTGAPKAAAVSHGALSAFLAAMRREPGIDTGDTLFAVAQSAFDIALLDILLPLVAGARLVLAEPDRLNDGELLAAGLAGSGASLMQAPPSTWRLLLAAGWEGDPALRALSGGEALPRALAGELLDRTGSLWNLYGPTETTIYSTGARVEPGDGPVPIGGPIPGTTVHVLDECLEPLPDGMPGEVYIGGLGLARGYLGDPAATAERFVPDPHARVPGSRLYRTGDRAKRLACGALVWLGRVDRQIKLRGHRIEPSDVEAALERHPAVRAAVVTAAGEGDEARLVAFVAAGAGAEPAALRAFAAEQLPAALVPAQVVVRDALPVTTRGKRDVGALLAALPARDAPAEAQPESPLPAAEQQAAAIWSDVLGCRVEPESDFFELGGHSLLAVRVVSRVKDALGVELRVRDVFENPTLRAFARLLTTRAEPATGLAHEPDAPPVLSFGQERLLFLEELDPGTARFNIANAVWLEGPIDTAALDWSLRRVVARHEPLRSTYRLDDGVPTARVEPQEGSILELVELVELDESDAGAARAEAHRVATDVALRPFDLAASPHLRAVLVRVAPEEHLLVLCVHHIAGDAWSLEVLTRECCALYGARLRGEEAGLPELPVRYADFARWQRAAAEGPRLEGDLDYWRRRLLPLPASGLGSGARRRPTGRAATHPFSIDRASFERLERIGRAEGATPFMTLLASLKALLHQYTGADDITVGTPVAKRGRVELEPLVGFFVNTLVLRDDLADVGSFRELVKRVRDTVFEAFEHQDVPFELLVAELQPERRLDRSPLFDVLFVFDRLPGALPAVEGVRMTPAPVEIGIAHFDLTVTVVHGDDALTGYVEYDVGLFDAERVERLTAAWLALVDAFAADADRPVAAPPEPASGPAAPAPRIRRGLPAAPLSDAVHQRAAECARRRPGAPALAMGERRLTYGELDAAAADLARRLRAAGAGPETRVGILAERSPEAIVAMLGTLRAGAAYVPLAAGLPEERLRRIVADAGIGLAVAAGAEAPPGLPVLPALAGPVAAPNGGGPERPPEPVLDGQLAYVMYTSGSTGAPKGVMVEHGSLDTLVRSLEPLFELTGDDRVLQFAALSWDTCVEEIYPTLVAGATLVLRDPGMADDARSFIDGCAAAGVTVVNLPTAFWHELCRQMDAGGHELPPSLRLVVVGGEPLADEVVDRWRRRSTHAPRLLDTYGTTEATAITTARDATSSSGDGDAGVDVGGAIANSSVHVLGRELAEVPPDFVGELYVGGAGVARGYLGRPALTAERFVPDPRPDLPGARLYRTGDVVRALPGGGVRVLGRADAQVKVRGGRVEPSEVAGALLEHPAVHDAAVVPVATPDGSGTELAAYVAGSAAPRELREHLRGLLPGHMLPRAIVPVESLPRTVSGKLAAHELPPPREPGGGDRAPEEPRSDLEALLLGVCGEVLGVEARPSDNFFELGGYSLLAMRATARLCDVLGVELPLRALFEARDFRRLAELAVSARAAGLPQPPPLERAPAGEPPPLSYAQQRLWFLQRLAPEDPAYNMPTALHVRDELDLDALDGALADLAGRHDVLRTTFPDADGTPFQRVAPRSAVRLTRVDLRSVPEERRAEQAWRVAGEVAALPFDLATGPLWRACAIRLGEREHGIVLVFHHAICDAWSLGVVASELTELYRCRVAGTGAPPAPPFQYADYAHWQRRLLEDGDRGERMLGYWRRRLAGIRPLSLAAPVSGGSGTGGGGAAMRTLDPDLDAALRRLAADQGATLFMTLLAAFQALLYRYTGERDIAVGSPVAGRRLVELERLVGCFVNTVVLRGDTGGDPSFAELVARARATCLDAFAHADLPFERVVEEVAPERRPSAPPLFQIGFGHHRAEAPVTPFGDAATPVGIDSGSVKYELSLVAVETGDSTLLVLEHDTARFDGPFAERMLDHLLTLLSAVTSDPARRLSSLRVLRGEELSQEAEWNATEHALGPPEPLHELVARQAERSPGAEAVACGGRSWSYAELEERAAGCAAALQAAGAGPERTVGVCMERSEWLVAALLGTLRAGAAYVPLDPEHPPERLAALAADAGVVAILTDAASAARAPATPGIPVLRADEIPGGAPAGVRVHPDGLLSVMFTSGSTGRPKGVMTAHAPIVNRLRWMADRYAIGAGDRVLHKAPFGFDVSIWELFLPLMTGGTVVVASPGEQRDPVALRRLMERERVTAAHFVPSMLDAFLEQRPAPLESLRLLVASGETLRAPTAERGRGLLGVEVENLYGPTEAAIDVTAASAAGRDPAGSIPIGRPIANVTVHVLDADLEPVPAGLPGELCIGGAAPARGYLGDPALTAERFVPHPFAPGGGRLYRTGDVARRLPNGEIEFLGRADRQVKVRGVRLEPAEVESAVEAHPDVRAAAVIARHDAGETRLLGFYAARGGLGEAALREHLRHRVPAELVPERLIAVDELPLTVNGKLDVRALERIAGGAPRVRSASRPPDTELERELAAMWAEVLGPDRASDGGIGMDDDFFGVGGHSLLLVRIAARIEAAFGVEVALGALFDAPTIAGMTTAIAHAQLAREDPAVAARLLADVRQRTPAATTPAS
jgi:amino acid adenylation domain-containing protein